MAETDQIKARIKKRIAELAQRPRQVRADEIDWVARQLAQFHSPNDARSTGHGMLYTVGAQRFHVCTHNRGDSHVKKCYVDEFLNAMFELGWYEG